MHLLFSVFSYSTHLFVTPSLTPVLFQPPPLIIPHQGWSSPPSLQAAGRPAGSWRRGAHRGWGGWEHKTRSFFVKLPQRWHLGRALHSNHRKLRDDLQGPLRKTMQQRWHDNRENTSKGWECRKTWRKKSQELILFIHFVTTTEYFSLSEQEIGCTVLWNEKNVKESQKYDPHHKKMLVNAAETESRRTKTWKSMVVFALSHLNYSYTTW